jgi:hypothetical protein
VSPGFGAAAVAGGCGDAGCGRVCAPARELASEFAINAAPSGSANAIAEPSTRRESVRLDDRRIIISKVEGALRKASKSGKLGQVATGMWR